MNDIEKELKELKATLKRLYEAIILYLCTVVGNTMDILCVK